MQQLPAATAPLITIYRPYEAGGRWIARADLNIAGERIELQAGASPALYGRARGWYNRAAEWIGRYIKLGNGAKREELGKGVFADMPEIAASLATSPMVAPYHPDIEAAADLYFAAHAGQPAALQQIENIAVASRFDPEAEAAMSDLLVVRCAHQGARRLPMARIFQDAASGEEDAIKVLAALREVTPAATTRLSWDLDEWQRESPRVLCGDVISACADEIGARLVMPTRWPHVRQVKPLEGAMLSTYRAILAAYGG